MTWAQYPKRDAPAARRVVRLMRAWLGGPVMVPVFSGGALLGVTLAESPWQRWLLLGLAVLAVAQRFLRLDRRRLDYSSGDHRRVSSALAEEWSEGTASRRLRALAMVGLGDFAAARRDLLSPRDADHEDRELRLCTHIVMLAFEGQALPALGLCHSLLALPIFAADGQARRRRARREGIVALARALCGAADEDDYRALQLAVRFEPALHWACRYGAAVACCVKSEANLARKLVEHAPRWPQESAFCQLHSRIIAAALA